MNLLHTQMCKMLLVDFYLFKEWNHFSDKFWCIDCLQVTSFFLPLPFTLSPPQKKNKWYTVRGNRWIKTYQNISEKIFCTCKWQSDDNGTAWGWRIPTWCNVQPSHYSNILWASEILYLHCLYIVIPWWSSYPFENRFHSKLKTHTYLWSKK